MWLILSTQIKNSCKQSDQLDEVGETNLTNKGKGYSHGKVKVKEAHIVMMFRKILLLP